jgi:hypothetical protein
MRLGLTEKFIKGLKNYNLTIDDIENSGFKYCGGNKGRHLNYYKLIYGNREIPYIIENCVCGHNIKENCYITNGDITLTLGICCIKKFLPGYKQGRTCEKCEKPHKNRICNTCNDCRNLEEQIERKEKCNREQEEHRKQYERDQQKRKEKYEKELKDRIYLCVNYDKKDEAKQLGAKWDSEKKLWYAPNLTYKELLKKF